MNSACIDILRLVIAAIGGGIIAAPLTDWLVRRREHESGIANRKRDFLEFMARWRAEFDGWNHVGGGRAEHYQRSVAIFRGEARRIENDFDASKRNEFKKLIDIAGGFTPASVDSAQTGKELILKAIDEIIRFTDAA